MIAVRRMANNSPHTFLRITPKDTIISHSYFQGVVMKQLARSDKKTYSRLKKADSKLLKRSRVYMPLILKGQHYPKFTFFSDMIWSNLDNDFHQKFEFDLFLYGSYDTNEFISIRGSELPLLDGIRKYGDEYMRCRPIRLYFTSLGSRLNGNLETSADEICHFPLILCDPDFVNKDKGKHNETIFNLFKLKSQESKLNGEIVTNEFDEQYNVSDEWAYLENDYFEFHFL